jgi:hypothetical protein
MNIKNTFLKLTSKTYPYGFEEDLEHFLPKKFKKDLSGNYFYKLGDSKTAFTCHLDTACLEQVKVNHIIDGNMIRTNGKSILGADDKAGMTILLYMIEHNVPGLYCFFIGEEVGCIGSGYASLDNSYKVYDRIISFDRRGTTSVITHQSSKRCCSDEFAKSLVKEFNKYDLSMIADDTGIYTDSAEFITVISECTNISVGYYNEHTYNECQDIVYLEKLAKAVVRIDWESLPTKRKTNVIEYKSKPKYNDGVVYDGFKKKKNRYNDRYNEYDDFVYKEIKEIKSYKQQNKHYYEPFKQSLYDDNITKQEFEKIKDMYLDLNDPADMDYYLKIKDSL